MSFGKLAFLLAIEVSFFLHLPMHDFWAIGVGQKLFLIFVADLLLGGQIICDWGRNLSLPTSEIGTIFCGGFCGFVCLFYEAFLLIHDENAGVLHVGGEVKIFWQAK